MFKALTAVFVLTAVLITMGTAMEAAQKRRERKPNRFHNIWGM